MSDVLTVTSDNPTLTLSRRGALFDAASALQARLELAFPPAQFEHQVVPARLSKPVWERLTRRCPFIGRGFAGLTPARPNSQRIWRGDAAWTVFLGVQNSKMPGLLLGDALMVGQLGLVGVATALLHGWTVRGLGTWQVGAMSNLYAEEYIHDDIGVVAVEVSVGIEMSDEAAAMALPEFLQLGATWDLPPLDTQVLDVRQTPGLT